MSDQSTEQDESTRHEPYRITFGKCRGSTIQELHPDYRQALIDAKAYEHYSDFKSALIADGYLQPIKQTDCQAVSQLRKRKAMESTSPPPKKPALCARQSSNSVPELADHQQAADLYYLDFGMHAGKRLSEVPSSYIDWLIKKEVHTSRPTLAAALRILGRLDSPRPALEESLAPVKIDSRSPALSTLNNRQPISTGASDSRWRAPAVLEARGNCFFDPFLGSPRWISDKDTETYFNLRVPMLAGAGVRILTGKDLDMYSDYGSMFSISGVRKRWLYQVFACAEHFNTVSHGTAQQALQKFLGKNEQREGEITAGLGLGM